MFYSQSDGFNTPNDRGEKRPADSLGASFRDLAAARAPQLESSREKLRQCLILEALSEVSTKYFSKHFPSPWTADERQLREVHGGLLALHLVGNGSTFEGDNQKKGIAFGFFKRALNNLRAFERLEQLEDIDGTYRLGFDLTSGKLDLVRITDPKEALSETFASLWLVGRAMSEAAIRPKEMKILIDEMQNVLKGQESRMDLNGSKQFHFSPIVLACLMGFIEDSRCRAEAKLTADEREEIHDHLETALVLFGLSYFDAQNALKEVVARFYAEDRGQ
jgi:hypothetical protein